MEDSLYDRDFDPYHLLPLASLNRRKVAALPGIAPELVGSCGAQLLNKHALLALIEPHAADLGFAQVDPAEYPQRLNAVLDQPGSPANAAAESIAGQFGLRLGVLLASMLLAPEGLTAPPAPWEASYLRHWKQEVRLIYLGGGLANGRLGQLTAQAAKRALSQAKRALSQCGVSGLAVRAAANPSFLALTGAARSIPGGARAAVVADFGQSRGKRGLAFYDEARRLQKMVLFPTTDIRHLSGGDQTAALAEKINQDICEVFEHSAHLPDISPHILCSVAAYVQDGQPLDINRGPYTMLNRLAPDLKGWFAQQIGRRLGRKVTFAFAHDGDAAACALAGEPHAALIMLGSGMGVGFVPPAGDFRALDGQFVVVG